jgi:transcription-repair coupling factor (superfamily II helicase)
MIDEAVETMGAEDGDRPTPEPLRFDVAVDAYLPADYVPFEAAKIDLHRRIAASLQAGDLREIREELEDRFGPPPVEAVNLLELQRARIELAAAGASRVEFRGGRLSVAGVELDSEQVEALGERVEGVIYEWREQVVALRVPDQPEARLGAVVALGAALGEAKRAVAAAA